MTAGEPGRTGCWSRKRWACSTTPSITTAPGSDGDSRLAYLGRLAALLHRLVDATGDEASRYPAQDAEDRADRAWSVAGVLAEECGDPPPAPRRPRR